MKIVCYGDSNTYGWDPRYFSGNRYPYPWPELMGEQTGHQVINCGEPGRVIPSRPDELDRFRRDVQIHQPDLLVIMLGTNDLFYCAECDAASIAKRMEHMVSYAIQSRLSDNLLLLSCPRVADPEAPLLPVLEEMSEKYRQIAEQAKIHFADPFRWKIPLAYDGLHFTEEGHQAFAEEMVLYVDPELAGSGDGL